ncbi:para-aminobenzoate synthetase/4-amino-4-deoxychorismate lyase [Litorimonas taeanensis]|uniref:Probable branched-chain-amino-acid aminotransferase n=1 Tax=Litorimonas taeanensis TaxID=568099 RepID=A0A420WM30_9PROT|nr:aminodeoxychorismate synthase component I [Litorimonas taeanensis]RKQ72101.1 para-aminobenzoate synthetase/4-amino-4-deoxychorismate lyase [Litorimonas taeanensis]
MRPYVLLDDQKTGETRYFTQPIDIITAYNYGDLSAAFEKIENYQRSGYYLAGFLSYELGYALEPSLRPLLTTQDKPLIQLGVFKTPPKAPPANSLYRAKPVSVHLEPQWSLSDYLNRYKKVQNYIEAGDVYQINLTFPLLGQTRNSAKTLYASFRRSQPGRYGGIVRLGGDDIISFSPELFFEKHGSNMRMRPMKGTRPRLSNILADKALRAEMQNEPKSKAENLMIVDLLRNDLSRLCAPGSVKVPELFAVETYPTVHQMISEVTGTLKENLSWLEIFKGLFPCGSITGAPKIRAIEIIHELETHNRSAYCGAIGYIAPNGNACFNVAIRTLQLNEGQLRYDVGSGVVLDSDGEDEYQECLLKAEIFKPKSRAVFETFRWEPENGYIRKDQHINRLLKAASQFKIPLTETQIQSCLLDKIPRGSTTQRIRLSLARSGKLEMSSSPLKPLGKVPLRICLSQYCLEPSRQITEHKVEMRDFYDGERSRLQALEKIDEVIFMSHDHIIMEGSFTTVYIEENGQLLTPKLKGILPGILRQDLVNSEKVTETEISLERFLKADKIFIGNSLRGLLPAILISKKRL